MMGRVTTIDSLSIHFSMMGHALGTCCGERFEHRRLAMPKPCAFGYVWGERQFYLLSFRLSDLTYSSYFSFGARLASHVRFAIDSIPEDSWTF